MSYLCSCCGETHEGLPDLAFDRPTYASEIAEEERVQRVWLDNDFCIIDERDHFIRGIVEIPIIGEPETFGIGVWVSQKPENFWTYFRHFDSADIGPFFGWFSNQFVFAGEPTLNPKSMVHFRGGDLRPSIELEPNDHPFSQAQQDGLSLDQVWLFIHEQIGP